MTILPIAVRAKLPLVIFAGEAPLNKDWYNQKIEQKPFVEACGAKYKALHNPNTMIEGVHDPLTSPNRNVVRWWWGYLWICKN